MGLNFVIIFDNPKNLTPEEIASAVALRPGEREWSCFSYRDAFYASWVWAPRYFSPDEHPDLWEALRKYIVRVRQFLGGSAVYLGNDLLSDPEPQEWKEGEFSLPLRAPEEWLAEPDPALSPELAGVRELERLSW